MPRFTVGAVIDGVVERARSRGDDLLALSALRAAAVFGAAFAFAWVVVGGQVDSLRFVAIVIESPTGLASDAGGQLGSAVVSDRPLDDLTIILGAMVLGTVVAALFDAAIVSRCLSGSGGETRPDAALAKAYRRAPALILAAVISIGAVLLSHTAISSLFLATVFSTPTTIGFFWRNGYDLILFAVRVLIAALLLVYFPVILAEDHGAITALRRAVHLARGHLLALFGLALVFVMVIGLVTFAISLLAVPLAQTAQDPTLPLVPFVLAAIATGPLFPLLSAAAYERLVPAETEAGKEPAAAPTAVPA